MAVAAACSGAALLPVTPVHQSVWNNEEDYFHIPQRHLGSKARHLDTYVPTGQ